HLGEFWELNPHLKPIILDDYLRAICRRGPSIGIYERPNDDFPFIGYARMVFPLAGDGREIDMFRLIPRDGWTVVSARDAAQISALP
ncbi:MAG: hypothetical protein VX624_17370, partial [Pseudomonadota bacterium]|nr:hypothetical protein [Pseudomonadota bacterium]